MNPKIWNVYPAESLKAVSNPAERLVELALAGFPQLAADSLLNRENKGSLTSIINDAIDRFSPLIRGENKIARMNATSSLLEVTLNLLGMEGKRVGHSNAELTEVLRKIESTLGDWEKSDGGVAILHAVNRMLAEMKMVLSGKGMVAKMAEEIEAGLAKDNLAGSFIESSRKAIQGNIYYQIVDERLSKFGNDSATGLRWARHLGAVQVSSNPVIAARAYDEISDLWKKFETVSSAHPEWSRDPDKYSDEIALYGTIVSLLPNILDFRPIALLSDFKDGMVSIQLNPKKALEVEESVKDALKFYSILSEILSGYDVHLGARSHVNEEKTRPNIVFKVSTIGIEAITLTETLDEMGIGTNNTVTFTVAQEVAAALAAMRGLAAALKSGIPITTIYITNMEGRLEDHLREIQGATILRKSIEKDLEKEIKINHIARKIGALDDLMKSSGSLEQQIGLLCSKRYLKSLVDSWFIEAVGNEMSLALKQMEDDIRMSGIFVTRKAYQLMFKPSHKPAFVRYLAKEFGLSESQAAQVVGAVDLLPASKRRAEDTYLVLGDPSLSNLTNTEFPDHQLKVLQKSRESGFDLSNYVNLISQEPDPQVLARLLAIPDFRRGYELTPELVNQLERIGFEVPSAEAGELEPSLWGSYGPVRKTMDEFNGAYISFRTRLLSSLSSEPLHQEEITARAK